MIEQANKVFTLISEAQGLNPEEVASKARSRDKIDLGYGNCVYEAKLKKRWHEFMSAIASLFNLNYGNLVTDALSPIIEVY